MNGKTAKSLKLVLAAVVLAGIGASVAWLLDLGSNPAAPELAVPAPVERVLETAPRRSSPRKLPPVTEISPPVSGVNAAVPPAEPPPSPPPPPSAIPAPRQKETIQDPLARVALSLVGKDAEAEVIWLAAINNPDLPANERKDLIEDLNEDGFADPRRPTADDLPLIESRLKLIEDLLPDAMDETNAAALLEAYKDLIGMAERVAKN